MARTAKNDEDVVVADPQDTPPVLTQDGEKYETRGRTRVATTRGFAFASSNRSLPVVTSGGVDVTAEQAEFLVTESDKYGGHVFVVENQED